MASEGFEPEALSAKAAMPLQGRDRQETREFEKVVGKSKPRTRHNKRDLSKRQVPFVCVASEGFEPPKAEPADLQSDPFGRLGN